MGRFGLIGKKLSHSFSQEWFRQKFRNENIDAEYLLIEACCVEEAMELAIHQHQLHGFNVTIPFKKSIIPFCAQMDKAVATIGATNCILVNRGELEAYNTDCYGFEHLLNQVTGSVDSHGAIILGTGGAASAVEFVLNSREIPFIRVSRTPVSGYSVGFNDVDRDCLNHHPVIINTTPLGMFPDINGAPPLPYHLLSGHEVLIDLVYNPKVTVFMQEGNRRGCTTINGMPMLVKQAEKSWEIWNG